LNPSPNIGRFSIGVFLLWLPLFNKENASFLFCMCPLDLCCIINNTHPPDIYIPHRIFLAYSTFTIHAFLVPICIFSIHLIWFKPNFFFPPPGCTYPFMPLSFSFSRSYDLTHTRLLRPRGFSDYVSKFCFVVVVLTWWTRRKMWCMPVCLSSLLLGVCLLDET
jgi:hypothetical protein